jgi:hypothetical protein
VVNVFFATNRARAPAGDFSDDVHPNGPGWLAVGAADIGLGEAEAATPSNKRAHGAMVGNIRVFDGKPNDLAQIPGSAALIEGLRVALYQRRLDLIVYVHGFDTDFREAVWYAGQIKLQYNRVLRAIRDTIVARHGRRIEGFETLVLSWPSSGMALLYPREFERIVERRLYGGLVTALEAADRLRPDAELHLGRLALATAREADVADMLAGGADLPWPGVFVGDRQARARRARQGDQAQEPVSRRLSTAPAPGRGRGGGGRPGCRRRPSLG